MTDIKVCTDENSRQSSDIVICMEDQTTIPSDIKVCTDDERIDPCNIATELFVSGDSDCNVGDIYTASGGIGPYTWSFDSGTIDKDGEITFIGACGSSGDSRAGVITATDTCGSMTGLVVRLPGGEWGFNPESSFQCPTNIVGGTTTCITKITLFGIQDTGDTTARFQKLEKWKAYYHGFIGSHTSCPEYIGYFGGCIDLGCNPCTRWLDPCQDDLPRETCGGTVQVWHYRNFFFDWLCI